MYAEVFSLNTRSALFLIFFSITTVLRLFELTVVDIPDDSIGKLLDLRRSETATLLLPFLFVQHRDI